MLIALFSILQGRCSASNVNGVYFDSYQNENVKTTEVSNELASQ